MKKILVPVDFSEISANAMRYAIELAKETGSEIVTHNTFHVETLVGLNSPPVAYMEAAMSELQAAHEEKMTSFLANFRNEKYKADEQPIKISQNLLPGMLVDNVAALVEEDGIDMLVMGTKGASGIEEILWGSNTYNVIDNTTIPAWVVPANAQYEGISKIVFATQLSATDIPPIDDLRNICGILQAELTCLHISKPSEADMAKEQLDDLEKGYWFTPVDKLNFELVESESVEKGIMHYVDEHSVDLLAVRPKNRSFIESVLHTSISRKLTLHTSIPLLVIR